MDFDTPTTSLLETVEMPVHILLYVYCILKYIYSPPSMLLYYTLTIPQLIVSTWEVITAKAAYYDDRHAPNYDAVMCGYGVDSKSCLGDAFLYRVFSLRFDQLCCWYVSCDPRHLSLYILSCIHHTHKMHK